MLTFIIICILFKNEFLGSEGDYFYIIERGKFQVIVNGKPVAELDDGRSFGELALLYNTPRAATIRALTPCSVFSLDRSTFRLTLAKSSTSKTNAIMEALRKVPLLSGLTDAQLAKISDSVELLPFPAGNSCV